MPRAMHGDEWHCKYGGVSLQSYKAFSLEEAPPCGRASSRFLQDFTKNDLQLKNIVKAVLLLPVLLSGRSQTKSADRYRDRWVYIITLPD